MAVNPEQCLLNKHLEDKKLFETLEKEVDQKLLSTYQGDTLSFSIMSVVNPRVQKMFIDTYKALGWNHIEFTFVQASCEAYWKLTMAEKEHKKQSLMDEPSWSSWYR